MRAFLRRSVGLRAEGPGSGSTTRRRRAVARAGVEPLEGRALLSHSGASGPVAAMVGSMRGSGHDDRGEHGGFVVKAPQFYEFYVGPQRADLNVVAARATLNPGRGLVLEGVMAGKIDTTPATSADDSFYVFGINRGSPKAVAPFFNRPGVVFDAVVVVSVTHDHGVTASVRDLATGKGTTLPAGSVKIEGRDVRVTVDPSLLPTPDGGRPLSQATFNLWPRSSLANPTPDAAHPHPSFVASFIPENAMAPIFVHPGRRRG